MLGTSPACALFCSALFPCIPLADRPADKRGDYIKRPESAHLCETVLVILKQHESCVYLAC